MESHFDTHKMCDRKLIHSRLTIRNELLQCGFSLLNLFCHLIEKSQGLMAICQLLRFAPFFDDEASNGEPEHGTIHRCRRFGFGWMWETDK